MLSICHRCQFRQRPCDGPCVCTIDSRKRDIVQISFDGDCEKDYFKNAPQPVPITSTTFDGPAVWARIHWRAVDSASRFDPDAEWSWLKAILFILPCGECKQHWNTFCASQPPDLSSAEAYFAWTVAVHNSVNAKLNKPIMEIDDARRRWLRT